MKYMCKDNRDDDWQEYDINCNQIRIEKKMITQRDRVKHVIYTAKTEFYRQALSKVGSDSKSIFRILQELLNDYRVNSLPAVPPEVNAINSNVFL